jgi:hypothetical protein
MEETNEHETFETYIFDPCQVRFEYQGENLTFTDEYGKFFPRVSLRRCFPLSSENTNIIIRVQDENPEKWYELGMICEVYDLDECSLEAVLRELHLHYLVPMVLQIENIKEEFGFLYWSVETDRGHKEFIMRDSIISSTRQVSKGRWLLIDINQTRYEIHSYDALDTHSQNLLNKYLLL